LVIAQYVKTPHCIPMSTYNDYLSTSWQFGSNGRMLASMRHWVQSPVLQKHNALLLDCILFKWLVSVFRTALHCPDYISFVMFQNWEMFFQFQVVLKLIFLHCLYYPEFLAFPYDF
jgi:hypothetical protein